MAPFTYTNDEPIAVIGMGCRMPGGVDTPAAFWDMLIAKKCPSSARVPPNRFNIDAYQHENNERPGSFNVRGGYFLDGDPVDFDPTFFGISPIEAAWLDPQQRKMLETVYETFENSGTPIEKIAGSLIGSYVGSFTADFQQMSFRETDFRHNYSATGVDSGIIANRINNIFDLRGPSVTINTACSASMHCLHMACSGLRNGECDGAIVAGSNLVMVLDQHMNTAKLTVLSPTNQCHTFDESADGYARGECVGALYLKPLSAAVRDKDPIRAIIRSSAIGSNGKIPGFGITQPSSEGQARIIKAAHERLSLNLADTFYFECHGTGTQAGDFKELQGISLAVGEARCTRGPVLVGSVKPNTGHSEAASSISTVIKAILAIEAGVIPPTAGVTKLNPKLQWSEWNVKPVLEPIRFPPGLRRICINAFGYGGTNSSSIMQNFSGERNYKNMRNSIETSSNITQPSQPPAVFVCTPDSAVSEEGVDAHLWSPGFLEARSNVMSVDRPYLLVFSAHDETTLKLNLEVYSEIKVMPDLLDLAYTLGNRRSRLPTRGYAVARQGSAKPDILNAFLSDKQAQKSPIIAFVFTGQGAQWPKMGASLLETFPSFAETIDNLDSTLAKAAYPPTWRIRDCLLAPESSSRINEAEISQPLCTAVQIALVNLLSKWNIVPAATVGHSSGEIAASYAAGYISAEEAILVAYYRGKAMEGALQSEGAMLAVGLGAHQVAVDIESYKCRVVAACHNSPSSVTLSGDRDAIVELQRIFEARNVFVREIRTGGRAYHSHHMSRPAQAYSKMLSTCCTRKVQDPWKRLHCKMISTVTAETLGDGPIDPSYWVANLKKPVLFDEVMSKLLKMDAPCIDIVIEIGPHSALSGPIKQILSSNKLSLPYACTLKREEDDVERLLKLAGELWVMGADINMETVTAVETIFEDGTTQDIYGSLLVDLPRYQWNYSKRYYAESRQSIEHRMCKQPRHDILGRRLAGLSWTEPQWRNILRLQDLPWLKDHTLGGEILFPGTGYLAMAAEALRQLNVDSFDPEEVTSFDLRQVFIKSALVIPNDTNGIETILSLHARASVPVGVPSKVSKRWYSFTVSSHSKADNAWIDHATGVIGINMSGQMPIPKDKPSFELNVSGASWFRRLTEFGFDYGPSFQSISRVNMGHNSQSVLCDAIVRKECGVMIEESPYMYHPASMDSCLQSIIFAIWSGKLSNIAHGFVPTKFRSVSLWAPNEDDYTTKPMKINTWVTQGSSRTFVANTQLSTQDGRLLIDFKDVHVIAYEAVTPQVTPEGNKGQPYVHSVWKPDISLMNYTTEPLELIDLVDLALYKNPSAKILDVGGNFSFEITRRHEFVNLTVSGEADEDVELKKSTIGPASTTKVIMLDKEIGTNGESFDLVIASENFDSYSSTCNPSWRLLSKNGVLVVPNRRNDEFLDSDSSCCSSNSCYNKSDWISVNSGSRFKVLCSPMALMMESLKHRNVISPSQNTISLIARPQLNSLAKRFSNACSDRGIRMCETTLASVRIQPQDHVVILLDTDKAFLTNMHEEEWASFKKIINTVSKIFWVSFGGSSSGKLPDHASVSGLARVLRQETASLNLITVDVDPHVDSEADVVESLSALVLAQAQFQPWLENEYAISGRNVFINRLLPAKALNENLTSAEVSTELITLDGQTRLAGTLQGSQVYFQRDESLNSLGSNEVELEVLFVGLNEEDALSFSGRGYRPTINHEVGGVVTRMGDSVSGLNVGDSVIGFAFGTYSTHQRMSANLLCPVPSSDLQSMMSLPVSFVTALYGLNSLARIEEAETALILANIGPVLPAVIQVCKRVNANVFIVAESESVYVSLIGQGFADQAVIYGKEGFCEDIRCRTKGAGVDVVFGSKSANAFVLDQCVSSLNACARVVLFGPKNSNPEALDAFLGQQEFNIALFDIMELCEKKPKTISKLLKRSVEQFRNKLDSNAIYPLSEVEQKLSHLLHSSSCEKQVISLRRESLIKMLAPRPTLKFDPDAVYLLVGCLRGLGRSLAGWMVDRGARNLAFMARSGASHPIAAKLVSDLQSRGVKVTVLKADVRIKADVETSIQSITRHHALKGVVNAAMVLNDSVFETMTLDQWQSTLEPKVKGSWILHEATASLDLDFFVLTSSVSGIIGLPGQANYAAANTVQDSLCRSRRTRGLPATSLILSMVLGCGVVADNSNIEDSLLRKGLYGLDEDDLLNGFEMAMKPRVAANSEDCLDHIIVGLEPSRLAKSLHAPKADSTTWFKDTRFVHIQAAVQRIVASGSNGTKTTGSGTSIMADARSAATIEEAVEIGVTALKSRLARLLDLDEAAITADGRSVSAYGLDSMIATEFRSWIFREFGSNVPYQHLLTPTLTVKKLARELVDSVRSSGD